MIPKRITENTLIPRFDNIEEMPCTIEEKLDILEKNMMKRFDILGRNVKEILSNNRKGRI